MHGHSAPGNQYPMAAAQGAGGKHAVRTSSASILFMGDDATVTVLTVGLQAPLEGGGGAYQ